MWESSAKISVVQNDSTSQPLSMLDASLPRPLSSSTKFLLGMYWPQSLFWT